MAEEGTMRALTVTYHGRTFRLTEIELQYWAAFGAVPVNW